MADEARRPIRTVRHEGIEAAIWPNKTDNGTFYNTTFRRNYKDAQGEWKDTDSFGSGDLGNLMIVAQMAATEIAQMKSQSRGGAARAA